ncbi:hypothetical protein HZA76_01890 [Candidatus Roizmanbacteria bacterium]|nr:hypothetical protein [Candidatus Roizmanbacteria bacterium]
MNKVILSLELVGHLVRENRYRVDPKTKFLSRCIDGRYPNETNLPALAFPGADLGELALIMATGNSYGFDVDLGKALKSLVGLIGGVSNFRLHTDGHADPKLLAGGCGHWKQINLDPKAYSLSEKEIDSIKKNLNIDQPIVLEGEHIEGAVLMVKGDWGVLPQAHLETDQGKKMVEVFIYHQSLVDERHRVLSKALIKNKAVKFYNGEDEDWLYEALSDMSENHLMETAKRLASDLPIYSVIFNEDGNFKLEKL